MGTFEDIKDSLTNTWVRITSHPTGRVVVIGILVLLPVLTLGNGIYKFARGPNVSVSEKHQAEEGARALKAAEEAVQAQNQVRAKAVADSQVYRQTAFQNSFQAKKARSAGTR